jgi:hypothetical protein
VEVVVLVVGDDKTSGLPHVFNKAKRFFTDCLGLKQQDAHDQQLLVPLVAHN